MQSRLLALLGAVSLGFAITPTSSLAQSTTFSDGTFSDIDWTAAIISDTTPLMNATFTALESASGGNPDSYRSTTHNWCGDGAGSDGLTVRHLHQSFLWDPAADGPIDSMSYSFDAIFSPVANPFAVAVILAARQNGNDYGVYHVATLPSWTAFTGNGIHAADFGVYSAGAPPIDFSPMGAPIQFGYMTANGTGNNECISSTSGLDNLVVTITSTTVVPPPADAGFADAEAIDLGSADAMDDAAGLDAAEPDAAAGDAELPVDTGVIDTGVIDTGIGDSGALRDSGSPMDAGSVAPDSGSDATGDEDCSCGAASRTSRDSRSGLVIALSFAVWFRRRRSG